MVFSSLKVAIASLMLCVSVDVFATIIQSLTLPLSIEYESNPQFSTSNKQSNNRIILTPRYSINSNQGANQFDASASVRIERSSDQEISQDRSSPSLNIAWSHDYETGQFSITALSNKQSTRVTELMDRGLVSGDNTVNTYGLSANWLNHLTDRMLLTLGSNITNVTYDGLNTTRLVNYGNESADARLTYNLSEQKEIFFQLTSSVYKPEGINTFSSKTISIDVGQIWDVNEKLNITSSIGSSETKNINDNNKSWQASISTEYETLRTTSNLSLSRSQSPVSTGSLNETNNIAVGWLYNLSEKDEVRLNYSWIQNLTINKTETKQFSVDYIRALSSSWDFQVLAEHRMVNDQLTNVSSSSIMATIIYRISDF